MSKRNVKLLLSDMIEAIVKIKDYTQDLDYESFLRDTKTLDAVIRNFEVLGEAANKVPDEFKNMHTLIPWGKITGIRNRVIHEYFGVDYGIIWQIIEKNLDSLHRDLQKVYKALN